ncbi:SNF2 family N-terminal domain-containing protein [Polychytrium aggregatum]|uniref:SNF2 family N-terminal domain-containing protein n=1 Tax=Polychytrium aggregatum TaxID=110093 RepID=UPI0022FDD72D|nr:SNF2 family N-terminal domain-containing protein [Polychytrium aggregatum]KAI9206746.1 SNF2 family N-terminal domain-containing protein [Polychytrium aggregatum]
MSATDPLHRHALRQHHHQQQSQQQQLIDPQKQLLLMQQFQKLQQQQQLQKLQHQQQQLQHQQQQLRQHQLQQQHQQHPQHQQQHQQHQGLGSQQFYFHQYQVPPTDQVALYRYPPSQPTPLLPQISPQVPPQQHSQREPLPIPDTEMSVDPEDSKTILESASLAHISSDAAAGSKSEPQSLQPSSPVRHQHEPPTAPALPSKSDAASDSPPQSANPGLEIDQAAPPLPVATQASSTEGGSSGHPEHRRLRSVDKEHPDIVALKIQYEERLSALQSKYSDRLKQEKHRIMNQGLSNPELIVQDFEAKQKIAFHDELTELKRFFRDRYHNLIKKQAHSNHGHSHSRHSNEKNPDASVSSQGEPATSMSSGHPAATQPEKRIKVDPSVEAGARENSKAIVIDLTDEDDARRHKPTAAPIDLTADDAVGAVTKTEPAISVEMQRHAELRKQQHEELCNLPISELVCYGQIDNYIEGFDPVAAQLDPNRREHKVRFQGVVEPLGNNRAGAVKWMVVDDRQMILGQLPANVASAYSKINTMARISATIQRTQFNRMSASIRIVFYGARKNAFIVGESLQSEGLRLLNPTRTTAFPVFNPMATSYESYVIPARTVVKQEDVESQIERVYLSLAESQSWEQAEPDPRLATTLYKHQKQALHFMLDREQDIDLNSPTFESKGIWKRIRAGRWQNLVLDREENTIPRVVLGGILADDMGLGKTIEVISLLLSGQPDVSYQTPAEAFGCSYPLKPSRATLVVCPLSIISNWEEQIDSHVKNKSFRVYVYHGPGRNSNIDFLASHDIVITTYSVLSIEFSKPARDKKKGYQTSGNEVSPLLSIHWYRVVLDEAHMIKDVNTGQSKAACELQSTRRWCLTGTPIQNKFDDLFALFKFLRFYPFDDRRVWNNSISKPIRQPPPANPYASSRSSMPSDQEALTRLQILMKAITLRRTKDQKLENGEPLLKLPDKINSVTLVTLDPRESWAYNQMHQKAVDIFNRFTSGNAIDSRWAVLLQVILRMRQLCNHSNLCKKKAIEDELRDYDALAQSDERPPLSSEHAVHIFNLLREGNMNNCGSCNKRVGSDTDSDGDASGRKLSSDDEKKGKFNDVYSADGPVGSVGVVTRCDHLFCMSCYESLFENRSEVSCPVCHMELTSGDIKEVEEDALDLEADGCLTSTLAGSQSSKIATLIRELVAHRSACKKNGLPPEKTVIFSQWTEMLNLLEAPLQDARFTFVRLDGTMNRSERDGVLQRFRNNPDVTIILVSLKAGGVGLNLTCASQIWIFEPYWNPAVEHQAIDRVHRIGQTRTVYTHRLIAHKTIEEAMLKLQENKLKMAKMALREKGRATTKEELRKQKIATLKLLLTSMDTSGARSSAQPSEDQPPVVVELD